MFCLSVLQFRLLSLIKNSFLSLIRLLQNNTILASRDSDDSGYLLLYIPLDFYFEYIFFISKHRWYLFIYLFIH